MEWREEDVQRVLEYLKNKVNLFYYVRERFQIGNILGLVSCPEVHEYFQGAVFKVFGRAGGEIIRYRSVLFNESLSLSLNTDGTLVNRVAVHPTFCQGSAYVMSIYFSPGLMENLRRTCFLDEEFFSAPDDVLIGLYAHECAEHLLHYAEKKIPADKKATIECRTEGLEFESQCRADLLACLFGFAEELKAFLVFRKERLLEQEDFPGGIYRPPSRMAEELQTRIDFLCRNNDLDF